MVVSDWFLSEPVFLLAALLALVLRLARVADLDEQIACASRKRL